MAGSGTLLICLAVYVIAGAWLAVILAERKGYTGIIWCLLGLVLGPLAWLILACLPDARRRRSCPHCAEQILPEATACPHCGRDVAAAA